MGTIRPGDSESNILQNKVDLAHVAGSSRDLREVFHVKDVGFGPDIYVVDEKEDMELQVV